jgi:hypothetical protein
MSKLKSFEQFVAEKNRAEEIGQEVVDQGTPDTKGTEEVEGEAKEVQADQEEQEIEESDKAGIEAEDLKDETEDVSTEKEFEGEKVDETPADDSKELELEGEGDAEGDEISESEEVEEDAKTVAEMLTEIYESSCRNEAKAYEGDAHDEHTVETYMKENAALVGALAAKALKEMKDEYTTEAYEAACNKMIESYSKKVNELKEMDHTANAEDVE